MRFISKYAKPMIGFQNEFVQYLPDGQGGTVANTVRPLLVCEFSNRKSLFPWEVKAAEKFEFRGGIVEADEMTPVSNLYRVSIFDTDEFAREKGLSDEDKAKLESFLVNHPTHGIDFVLVEEPRYPKPWPTYDEIRGGGAKSTVEKVIEQAEMLGYHTDRQRLEDMLAYERQNLNRREIIEHFEPFLIEQEEEQEELVSA